MVAQTFVHEYEMDGIIRFGKKGMRRESLEDQNLKVKKRTATPAVFIDRR